MNIHEYQAKALLRSYGLPVSGGRLVLKAEEAKTAASEMDGPLWVVKSQIHAGGRGKGKFVEPEAGEKGGVRLARSVEEAAEFARQMLGRTLVTIQTGEAGKQVNRIYIEDGSDIDREFYLALLIDRQTSRISIVASTEGGMDIEEVAHSTPEKILTITIDPATGLQDFHGRRIAFSLGLKGAQIKQCVSIVKGLYKLFVEKDMDMIEINPFCVLTDGNLKLLDAKMGFDGNALYRHPDIQALKDETEEDPKELAAQKFDLNYVALDGDIGCMVNGAGLAMATMDIIKLYGAEPANFLDVGGGATKEKVTEAFKIITSDPNVKGILVNIFGGIMRCDVIAEGVIAAVKEVGLKVPLVVRLEGTNVELGKDIIRNSGLNVIAGDNLADAAQKIVKAVKGLMRAALSLLALVAAGPALAQDDVLASVARKLDRAADKGGYAAGVAACLLGKGDAEATVAFFTEEGWTREDDAEMGLIYLAAPAGDFGAMLANDGTFCEVSSEAIGTDQASQNLVPTIMAAGLALDTGTDGAGCMTYLPAPGVTAVINSTGQDPVCQSDSTSAIRVQFE